MQSVFDSCLVMLRLIEKKSSPYLFAVLVCLCGELGDSHGGYVSLRLPPQKPQGALHPCISCGVLPPGTHYADRGLSLQTHKKQVTKSKNMVRKIKP